MGVGLPDPSQSWEQIGSDDTPKRKKEASRLPQLLILKKCSKEDSNLHRLPY
jgi:hypothetical protein